MPTYCCAPTSRRRRSSWSKAAFNTRSSDYQLYQLQAKCYAALNKGMQQHRALAEYYYRLGNVRAAIEQLQFAQKAGDGDYFVQSSVDARLRELRVLDNDGKKGSGASKFRPSSDLIRVIARPATLQAAITGMMPIL